MSGSDPRYLVFLLSGRLYALELAQVAEVFEPRTIWPVPATPPCYQGAMSFHGAIVAVMDLAAFMGVGEQRQGEKLIVLHPGIASLAFPAERVLRITTAGGVKQRQSTDDPFCTALLLLAEGEARLLDAAAIVEQATASINAPPSLV